MSETITLNHVPQLKMSRLKEWGYIKDGCFFNVSITWNHNLGWQPSKSICLTISMLDNPHLILNYKIGDEVIRYRVDLVSVPSNLGLGEVWYMVCPKTNKRCRKLHQVGKYFYHRTAFDNACYWSETFSKKYKQKYKDLQRFNKCDEGYNIIYSKHFRPFYDGKPTKNYLKALKWIEEGEGLSEEEIFYS